MQCGGQLKPMCRQMHRNNPVIALPYRVRGSKALQGTYEGVQARSTYQIVLAAKCVPTREARLPMNCVVYS